VPARPPTIVLSVFILIRYLISKINTEGLQCNHSGVLGVLILTYYPLAPNSKKWKKKCREGIWKNVVEKTSKICSIWSSKTWNIHIINGMALILNHNNYCILVITLQVGEITELLNVCIYHFSQLLLHKTFSFRLNGCQK